VTLTAVSLFSGAGGFCEGVRLAGWNVICAVESNAQACLSEWIHPAHDRWITVREAARLQSLRDGFIFHGSECQQLKQVGNAVPPLLGRAVARAVSRLLNQMPRKAGR
jgi:site-specific DNA-cytosine methylase